MRLNKKDLQVLIKLLNKIKDNSFEENDIRTLLMTIREHTDKSRVRGDM